MVMAVVILVVISTVVIVKIKIFQYGTLPSHPCRSALSL
jgi:hypothetical protein